MDMKSTPSFANICGNLACTGPAVRPVMTENAAGPAGCRWPAPNTGEHARSGHYARAIPVQRRTIKHEKLLKKAAHG